MASSNAPELRDRHSSSESVSSYHEAHEGTAFSPIRTGDSHRLQGPGIERSQSSRSDISMMLARRNTSNTSGRGGNNEEWAEIERLMSRMFGRERKAESEEEKTRHSGVVWKHLNVKGAGLGAALQPTVGDLFLGLPRLIGGLLTRGRKGAGKGTPVKTILHDFTVSLFPIFLSIS